MDERGDPVPGAIGSSQFQDLGMAPGQPPELPAHPFAGADVEMSTRRRYVLTNVEKDRAQAAFRQLPLQSTCGLFSPPQWTSHLAVPRISIAIGSLHVTSSKRVGWLSPAGTTTLVGLALPGDSST